MDFLLLLQTNMQYFYLAWPLVCKQIQQFFSLLFSLIGAGISIFLKLHLIFCYIQELKTYSVLPVFPLCLSIINLTFFFEISTFYLHLFWFSIRQLFHLMQIPWRYLDSLVNILRVIHKRHRTFYCSINLLLGARIHSFMYDQQLQWTFIIYW